MSFDPRSILRLVAIALLLLQPITDGIAAESAPSPTLTDPCPTREAPAESGIVRRRPGGAEPSHEPAPTCDSERLPAVSSEPMPEPAEVADRWQLVQALGYRVDWLDSYQGDNPLKGDRPVFGSDQYLSLSAISGSLLEDRRIAPASTSASALTHPTLTRDQLFFIESLAIDAVLYRGDTVFRPPDWQWRTTTVLSGSGTHSNGTTSTARTASAQALFFEKHLRDVSAHDDFDSLRVGIQPLTSDFRGFLLSDQPLAARLFGTRDNNVFQYNLAYLRRLPKNAVSLNQLGAGLPRNDVLLGNLYWQDFPRAGLTSELVGVVSRSTQPGVEVLSIGDTTVPVVARRAKHDYTVAYLGYGLDGHLGRLNATLMSYGALGAEQPSMLTGMSARVRAWLLASEWSIDSDWRRYRLSLLHASGAGDPRHHADTGFDGLQASPLFAGTDSSFFIHQQLGLNGGAFNLKARNALLPSLNPIGDPGQANFANPGLDLVGIGVDLDPAQPWRVSVDANELWFDDTGVLGALTGQLVPRHFGTELIANAFWRPRTNQNLIVRLSASQLIAGPGYRALYSAANPFSMFVFLTFSY